MLMKGATIKSLCSPIISLRLLPPPCRYPLHPHPLHQLHLWGQEHLIPTIPIMIPLNLFKVSGRLVSHLHPLKKEDFLENLITTKNHPCQPWTITDCSNRQLRSPVLRHLHRLYLCHLHHCTPAEVSPIIIKNYLPYPRH